MLKVIKGTAEEELKVIRNLLRNVLYLQYESTTTMIYFTQSAKAHLDAVRIVTKGHHFRTFLGQGGKFSLRALAQQRVGSGGLDPFPRTTERLLNDGL